jgi:hypothetical protein
MAIDLMRNFYKGAALRSGVKDSGEAMGGTVLDAFKTRQEAKQKFGTELAIKRAEAEIKSPLNESTIARNYSTAAKNDLLTKGGRNIFLTNRRTGDIYKVGDKTFTPVDPNTVGQQDRVMSVDIPPTQAMQTYSAAEASTKQIDDLINMLGSKDGGPNKFVGGLRGAMEPLQGLGSPSTQKYGLVRKDFSDRLLRLRSGAQINEQEYTRLMGMLPQWWRNTDADIEQLNKFKTEYTNLMNRITRGSIGADPNRADMSDDETNQPEEQIQDDDIETKKTRVRNRYLYGK